LFAVEGIHRDRLVRIPQGTALLDMTVLGEKDE
jgi:hypothetical protein